MLNTILTVIKVGPTIMSLHNHIGIVQYSESIDDVSAEVSINIFWLIFANSGSVPSPVCKVANNFIIVLFRPTRDDRSCWHRLGYIDRWSRRGFGVRVRNGRMFWLGFFIPSDASNTRS